MRQKDAMLVVGSATAFWAPGGPNAVAAPMGPTQSGLGHSAQAPDTCLMTNKSYDGQRYVELDQVNRKNVGDLKSNL